MRLIGMMDSPYVRRVAISFKTLGIEFAHEQISVFRQYDEFRAINPAVKAPSLITSDGVVLMDSTLILDYAERVAEPARRLMPVDPAAYLRSQRLIGLALAACEKTVQIVYETNLRPTDKQHQPWLDRVTGQLRHIYRMLDEEIGSTQGWVVGSRVMQADITLATAWRFTQHMIPAIIRDADHPALSALSQRAEDLREFRSSPLE